MRNLTLESSAGTIAVTQTGQGRPVVCLHATGHSGRDFKRLGERLGNQFSFYAIDWPGQGHSSHDPVPASAARYSAILKEIWPRLGLVHPMIIGNSIGGAAAIRFAAEHPSAVSGLVLCNPGGLTSVNWITKFYCRRVAKRFARGAQGDPSFPAWFEKYYQGILRGPAAEWRRKEIVASGPEVAGVLAQAWNSFANEDADIRHLVGQLQMPVLYAWAKNDAVVRWSWSKRAALTAPTHEVELFKGGHAAFLEQPAAFDKAFGRFAAQIN